MARPAWEHWLLNTLDEPVMRLDGVTGGSVTLQGLTRLGATGSIELDDRGQDIDWMRHRVQHLYTPERGVVEPWPVATMMLSSPEETYTEFGRSFTVGTLSKLQIVDEDTFPDGYSLPAGSNIIAAVVSILKSTGETRIASTPSDAVLRTPQNADPGESKLTVVNELLEAAGYWSLWADGSGQLRVEPYVDPADRQPAYEFLQGEASIHMPDWTRGQELSSVPNRFVCVAQGDDEKPALVGVAENTDPDSPFSFQARGRWITQMDEGVEAATQAVINQMASRRLLDLMAPVEHVKAAHALIPLSPNDAIIFEDSGYRQKLTVQNMTMNFTFDTNVDAEWRRTGAQS